MKSHQRLLLLFLFTSMLVHPSSEGAEPSQPPTIMPKVAIMIGELEYETATTLPKFAQNELSEDYRVITILEDPEHENHFLDIALIDDADVLLISVRRKTLPKDQLDHIRQFVSQRKPVIGIRTANHAFSLRGKPAPNGLDDWPEFDAEVFGGNYTNHHANDLKSTIRVVRDSTEHPIVAGKAGKPFQQGGSLYKTSPLAEGAQVLLVGEADGVSSEPVAWTFTRADGGTSFYTSLGHPADFENASFVALLTQAIRWTVNHRAAE